VVAAAEVVRMETPLLIQPRDFEHYHSDQRQYFRRLSQHEAPFLKEKLLTEKVMTAEQYEENFTEFKKYIGLAWLHKKPLAMTSKSIDEVWHQYILFTRDYMRFCNDFYGSYFHHNPTIASRPDRTNGLENLVQLYNQTYGKMPAVWDICDHVKERFA
jgi:hypothetical protein